MPGLSDFLRLALHDMRLASTLPAIRTCKGALSVGATGPMAAPAIALLRKWRQALEKVISPMRMRGTPIKESQSPSPTGVERLLATAIFIFPGAMTALSLDMSCRSHTWTYIRLPILFVLSLLVFLLPRSRAPFFVHLLFFLTFSYFALDCSYPYADRYIQYGLNKSLDVLSPFPGRHLYSTYQAMDISYPCWGFGRSWFS